MGSPPPMPKDEQERIRALDDLSILDTPPEERFDRITRLARRLFEVPIALVSLVHEDRQWFKSRAGLDATETPREHSFCAHAILESEGMVVPNAEEDPRFADNPLVTADPNIRFYAGWPIKAPGGQPIGTLCIIDRTPRDLHRDDAEILRDLAQLVEREIAAVELATQDELTGLNNRRGFYALSTPVLAMCRRLNRPASLLLFDLDQFKEINDTMGHAAGDLALKIFAESLTTTFRDTDIVGRLSGDEFVVLLNGSRIPDSHRPISQLRLRLDERHLRDADVPHVQFSVGAAEFDADVHQGVSDVINVADKEMYQAKRGRR